MPNRVSRFAEGVMEACWLLALVVSPLFFNIYSSRVFEPDKISLVRTLALVCVAAWLVKLINEGGPRFESVRSNYAAGGSFLRIPLVLPVASLVLIYLVATLFSVAPHASLFGSYQRMQGTFTTFSYLILFAAVAANLRRRAQVERVLTTVVITSLPIALYAIIQHYRLDPLPWGGDTTERVTANMGNAIFISAYLIMSALIVLGRVVTAFHNILTEEENERLPLNVVRAALYIFIFAVNLVAIYWSGSRGPWLGLVAGLAFFFLLLSLHWRNPALAVGIIGVQVVLAVFLVGLNIPNGPLEPLRQMPGVGRLGQVFETEGGTGRVRVLIWGGVIDLMLPHEPLTYPDGSVDRWNAIRPLIGYGPEALYVAFNRFYPPELGQLEARNASPDRSHNETFDALAFTGVLGLLVYLGLFTAVFYYSLKWLGLTGTPRRRNMFLGLILGSGVVTTVALMLWQGPEFFGVGLPFGMLLGLILYLNGYLAWYAFTELRARRQAAGGQALGSAPSTTPETWRTVALVSLFTAIVAHFTEIHFGIAIVSTRTHFWVFAALLLVLGFVLVGRQAGAEAAAAEALPARSRRRRPAPVRIASVDSGPTQEEWGPILVGAALTAGILVTLGFDFITNAGRSIAAGQILVDAFTRVPTALEGQRSYGVLGMVLMTWLGGGFLAVVEEPQCNRGRSPWSSLAGAWGLALLGGAVAWMIMSNHLANMASTSATTLEELMVTAEGVAATVSIYYGLLFLVVLGLAAAVYVAMAPPAQGRANPRAYGRSNTSPIAVLGYVALPLMAVVMSVLLNLRVIQADIIYKTGLQFDDGGQPQAAIPLYERALALAPGEDYYYLFLGRAYLNATAQVQNDPAQVEALLSKAEDQLKAARLLNPLNTDHTANLARLNRRWAELMTDPARRDAHAQASNDYYVQAVALSPNNAGLWNEWAALLLQVMGDAEAAQKHLDRSFSLDTQFDQTYQLQGDLYIWRARNAGEDMEARAEWYRRAVETYQQGIGVAEARGSLTTNLRLNLAQAYIESGQPALAIEQYQYLLSNSSPGVDPWRLHLAISELYAQQGDMVQARSFAEQALQLAPDTDKPSVQAWLDRLP